MTQTEAIAILRTAKQILSLLAAGAQAHAQSVSSEALSSSGVSFVGGLMLQHRVLQGGSDSSSDSDSASESDSDYDDDMDEGGPSHLTLWRLCQEGLGGVCQACNHNGHAAIRSGSVEVNSMRA